MGEAGERQTLEGFGCWALGSGPSGASHKLAHLEVRHSKLVQGSYPLQTFYKTAQWTDLKKQTRNMTFGKLGREVSKPEKL